MNIWTVLEISNDKLPDRCKFFSSLKDECISEKDYYMLLIFGICLK